MSGEIENAGGDMEAMRLSGDASNEQETQPKENAEEEVLVQSFNGKKHVLTKCSDACLVGQNAGGNAARPTWACRDDSDSPSEPNSSGNSPKDPLLASQQPPSSSAEAPTKTNAEALAIGLPSRYTIWTTMLTAISTCVALGLMLMWRIRTASKASQDFAMMQIFFLVGVVVVCGALLWEPVEKPSSTRQPSQSQESANQATMRPGGRGKRCKYLIKKLDAIALFLCSSSWYQDSRLCVWIPGCLFQLLVPLLSFGVPLNYVLTGFYWSHDFNLELSQGDKLLHPTICFGLFVIGGVVFLVCFIGLVRCSIRASLTTLRRIVQDFIEKVNPEKLDYEQLQGSAWKVLLDEAMTINDDLHSISGWVIRTTLLVSGIAVFGGICFVLYWAVSAENWQSTWFVMGMLGWAVGLILAVMVLCPMVEITSLCAGSSPKSASVVAYGWKWLQAHVKAAGKEQLVDHDRFMSYVKQEFRGICLYGLQISRGFLITVTFHIATLAPAMVTIGIKIARQLVHQEVDAQSNTSTTLIGEPPLHM